MDEEAMKKNLDRMAKLVGAIPFMKHLAMEFVEGGEGFATLRMRYQDEN